MSEHIRCNCHVYRNGDAMREDVTDEISFCPMHRAAPNLLAALQLCLPIMEAHTEASHLTDGFRPRVNKNDHILAKVKAAIEKGEHHEL